MPDFDAFLDTLKDDIAALAASHLDELRDEALKDGTQFLEHTKDDLKRWTRLMEQGKLSKKDVESLVRGRKELAKMEALKQAGLAAAEADRFRQALVDQVIDTATDVFL